MCKKVKREIIYYNPKLKELARKLRNNGTFAEIRMWKILRNKQMRGYDFHRQKPIDNHNVDFFCNELMLAIEVDGPSHNDKTRMDETRQNKIENLVISFLRFSEEYVLENSEGVWYSINAWIDEFEKTHPQPLSRGES